MFAIQAAPALRKRNYDTTQVLPEPPERGDVIAELAAAAHASDNKTPPHPTAGCLIGSSRLFTLNASCVHTQDGETSRPMNKAAYGTHGLLLNKTIVPGGTRLEELPQPNL